MDCGFRFTTVETNVARYSEIQEVLNTLQYMLRKLHELTSDLK
jgi:hypothetical protein